MIDIKQAEADAWAQIHAEDHYAAVQAEIERIKRKLARPWWQRVFPFRIRIERIN